MFDLTLKERLRIAALSAERSKRSAITGMLASKLLSWSFAPPPPADHILIIPQDLRTADPSFWREVEQGQFGLAGSIAFLRGCSPFDIVPPNTGWLRELHGFGWLRNLDGAMDEGARQAARRLCSEWALRYHTGTGVSAEPAVAARRLISWISHADLLLEDADNATYDRLTDSLGRQLAVLSGSWRESVDGHPRLLALIALTFAGLSIAGHDRQLKDAEIALSAELDRQILPDGGHMSRNPAVLVELMLDLLPLSQCFLARTRRQPPGLLPAMARIMPMLRFLRLGDGMLARFNGMGVPMAAGLGTVLAYDDGAAPALSEARASGYARLERAGSIVLADVGTPPPLAMAGEAQAGCLSFEMSAGARLLFVNGGMPGAAGADWNAIARATASHNTLCLAEKASSKLIPHRRLEALVGAPPIRHPDHVAWHMEEVKGGVVLQGRHDGYCRRFGLVHSRRLLLSADGLRVEGCDRLGGRHEAVRLRQDLPFAIHFHLCADAGCRMLGEENAAEIELSDGQRWRLRAHGATLAIEESTCFANSTGPRRALQIVLRGATHGESEVHWKVERMYAEETE
ncbi:heparinase II/III family protein [Methylocystis sp.]|uniref:heparinase II/III family protein n=1 Tax=Methylocystis sp. TaxID=1911079 RepID=UPI003DA20B7B